jgi:hypothetical protein
MESEHEFLVDVIMYMRNVQDHWKGVMGLKGFNNEDEGRRKKRKVGDPGYIFTDSVEDVVAQRACLSPHECVAMLKPLHDALTL